MAYLTHRELGRPKIRRDRPLPARVRRRIWLERLEDRTLLASIPFGALPDDTGEFMLGDVLVSVVLMESDSSLSPFDQDRENWTPDLIAGVKARVEEGLNWWVQTLDAMEGVRDGLLSFAIDWTYTDNPVRTGYEPISRPSTDFSLWVDDFLHTAGFTQGNDFLQNIRAFNNAQRIAHQKHWAFTLFVVNNAAELAAGQGKINPTVNEDGRFAPGGLSLAFAYAGGNAIVMPQDRPASTVAHETGHIFWALDEYNRTSAQYSLRRGYYDTQNSNANPSSSYTPEISIMSRDASLEAAYAGLTSSTASLEMIGWKDSDGDGIFDVLDVEFSLVGSGQYDPSQGTFYFLGTSAVGTLENQNPSGLQNDITINEIRQAQYKFDDGEWQTAAEYQAYQVNLDLEFPVPGSPDTVTIRTIDTRTGVTSSEYVYTFSGPPGQLTPGPGAGGYVIEDPDSDGWQDPGEWGLGGFQVGLIDENGNSLNLRRTAEPDNFVAGLTLNLFNTGVHLTAVGGDVASAFVRAQDSTSAPSAGRVFGVASSLEGGYQDTFTSARRLMAEFTEPVTSVSVRAFGVQAKSVARMEAFNADGELLVRTTSGVLGHNESTTLSISRPTADIAYVVIKGHAGTRVVLDNLQWGAVSSTETDALGAWTLPTLPHGEYRIAVTPRARYQQTGPATGYLDIVVDGSGIQSGNFHFVHVANPWHNLTVPYDVNGDGNVTPRDALAVINWLNARQGAEGELPPEPEPTDSFVDVSDDGRCSPRDALLVINELNRRINEASQDQSGESEGFGSASTGGLSTGGSATAEGESSLAELAGSALASRYYNSSPFHAQSIPGVDPNSGGCTCGQCDAINAVAQALAAPAAVEDQDRTGEEPFGSGDSAPAGSDVHLDMRLLAALADDFATARQRHRRGQ